MDYTKLSKISDSEDYVVIQTGGSIGESGFDYRLGGTRARIVHEGLSAEEAKEKAASMRKTLSPGEKSYYRISYKAVPKSKLKKVSDADERYDKVMQWIPKIKEAIPSSLKETIAVVEAAESVPAIKVVSRAEMSKDEVADIENILNEVLPDYLVTARNMDGPAGVYQILCLDTDKTKIADAVNNQFDYCTWDGYRYDSLEEAKEDISNTSTEDFEEMEINDGYIKPIALIKADKVVGVVNILSYGNSVKFDEIKLF